MVNKNIRQSTIKGIKFTDHWLQNSSSYKIAGCSSYNEHDLYHLKNLLSNREVDFVDRYGIKDIQFKIVNIREGYVVVEGPRTNIDKIVSLMFYYTFPSGKKILRFINIK